MTDSNEYYDFTLAKPMDINLNYESEFNDQADEYQDEDFEQENNNEEEDDMEIDIRISK